MYISMNWIKDFVNLDGIETEELIKKFNLTTAEIEGYEVKGSDTTGVIFARIEEVENHPNSDHLHILKVNTGTELLQIVCGAPNVRTGMTVCLAPIGSKVQGHKMGKAKLAGIESYGMCCSEEELGIGSDNSGIMDIDFDVKLGADIKTVFPIDDVVFEVDNKSLTNRPDLWGHYGIAREFSAMFNRELKPLCVEDLNQYENLNKLNIEVNDENCYRYSSMAVKNITRKLSSQEIKIRLNYCRMRDLNLLTDLTNYLMLELGQPMHAFDNEIVNGIHVNKATNGTKLLTLEGEEHEIPENATIICDLNNQPVAIAGIKGGKLSGITENTTSLLLESACFDCKSIRTTSTKIGLKTDASQRYEKSLDPELTKLSIARFIKILKDLDSNIIVNSKFTDVYNKKYPKIEIEITSDFISKRIGLTLNNEKILNILNKLGFVAKEENNIIKVNVPSYRATKDISLREDLVEEIARSYGYDNITPTPIYMEVKSNEQNTKHTNEYNTKFLLAEKYSMNEVHSYLWNYESFNNSIGLQTKSYLSLVDSSNAGQSGIRSELAPTLLKFVEENKANYNDIKIFEVGKVADGIDANNLAIEKNKLAIVLASQKSTQEEIYFKLKEILLDIAVNIYGVNVKIGVKESIPSYYHPTNSTSVISNNNNVGTFGLLHPAIKNNLDKKLNIGILEIDLDLLSDGEPNVFKFNRISKYQDVNIDYSLMIPKNMSYEKVKEHLDLFKCKLKWSYNLIDTYESEDLGNYKSWTFKFNIYSMDKTLSSKDIEIFNMRILSHMEEIGITIKN